jgi:hypothetical protein
MSHVRCHNVSITQIDEQAARSMFQIFSRYYVDVDFDRFQADLHDKDRCILLCTDLCPAEHNPGGAAWGRIVGFSTLVRTQDPGPFGATYLFSGDTVIDKGCWGQRLLERAFFWIILREKLLAPWRPLHWMLISKGFVTYLMMVRNFPSSFPRFDRVTPVRLQERLDRYYAGRYGDDYCARTGVIRSSVPHGAVRGRLAEPKGTALEDPDVKYFVKRNPDYSCGDELVCIAEIRIRDFARHFTTAFRRRRNRRTVDRRAETRRESRPAVGTPSTS